jgi:hypothetical protein
LTSKWLHLIKIIFLIQLSHECRVEREMRGRLSIGLFHGEIFKSRVEAESSSMLVNKKLKFIMSRLLLVFATIFIIYFITTALFGVGCFHFNSKTSESLRQWMWWNNNEIILWFLHTIPRLFSLFFDWREQHKNFHFILCNSASLLTLQRFERIESSGKKSKYF